jgi:hypothetical protein
VPRLRWSPIIGWAALGLVGGLIVLAFNVASSIDQLGGLVDTKPDDPAAAAVFGPELGPDATRAGGWHDGHYYYLVARAPMHLEASVPYLDRPNYRLGRPALPWLAWALHPSGGGPGLVWAMFAVGVAGVFAGAVGSGALSVTLGGKPWVGAIFPILLGSILSLRISVPDPMAAGFGVCAVLLLYRRHLVPALLLGVLAVLSKESILLLFLGVLIPRRDRDSALLFAIPAAALVTWQVWLRIALGSLGHPVAELGPPLQGAYDSARFWLAGNELLGFVGVMLGLVLAALALVRRRMDHPLSWALVVQCVFLLFLNVSVMGPERNGPRAVLPLTMIAIIMLATPRGSAALAKIDQSFETTALAEV